MRLQRIVLSMGVVGYVGLSACLACGAQGPQTENQEQAVRAAKAKCEDEKTSSAEGGAKGNAQEETAQKNELGLSLIKNLARDQKAIWTSPADIRLGDPTWVVPFAGLTAGFLVTDRDAVMHQSNSPATLRHYTNFSSVAGFSGWATAGRWVAYARSEFQHAPPGPEYSSEVQTVLDNIDNNPGLAASPQPARNQRGFSMPTWDSIELATLLWAGEPVVGSRAERSPALHQQCFSSTDVSYRSRLAVSIAVDGATPWTMRWDAFFEYLQGNLLSPSPFFHGEKISFKPTPNLEFGFTRTVEVGGPGRAFRPYRFFLSYFSATSYKNKPAGKDAGKRDGGFDFSYRLPLLRKWLTIYNDSLSADDPSPLAAPRRAAISPGLYLRQFPGLPKLDLRVEAPLSNTVGTDVAGRYIYWDNYYHGLTPIDASSWAIGLVATALESRPGAGIGCRQET